MKSTLLALYLRQCFPSGLGYEDAAQLCLHLHCVASDLPENLHEQTERQTLACSFAELARFGWIKSESSPFRALYGAYFHQITDLGHWIEVIASLYKIGDVRDIERGKLLAHHLHQKEGLDDKTVA